MNFHQKLAVATSSLALLTTTAIAPATAANFKFSYSGSNINGDVDASGVLTTDDYNAENDSYLITGITGTRNGVEIDSLLPPGSSSFEDSNNNLLFSNSPQVDFCGFSYTAGGSTYNLFSIAGSVYGEKSADGAIFPVTFSATPTAVPEPSSILGTLGVSVLFGGALLKRKLKSNKPTRLMRE